MSSQQEDNTMILYLNSNIHSLTIDVGSSTNTKRVANIIKMDGTVTQCALTLQGNLSVATGDAILDRLGACWSPLSEMRAELDKLRAMIGRYKDMPALQPADRARIDGLNRLVDRSDQMLLRAADMNLLEVLTNPAARLQKKRCIREGNYVAAVVADSLQEEGDRVNRDNLGLDTPTFNADKCTLAEVATIMKLWSKAFDDELFN